jgi:GNAT superfamily N-acetyltransferase
VKIVECAPELLGSLTPLVNDHIRSVPPGWTLSDAQAAATVADAAKLWRVHYPGAPARDTSTVCVIDRGQLVGAAQWSWARGAAPSEGSGEDGDAVIEWIVSLPQHTAGTAALLGEVVRRLRSNGCRRVSTGRFAFGIGWLGIPTSWPHITGALARAGFSVQERWRLFTGSTDVPTIRAPAATGAMRLRWTPNDASLEWDLTLSNDEGLVGECDAWGAPPHLACCNGYCDWVTIEWLGVEPRFRMRGIGRWLLGQQLHRQAIRGATQAMLWSPVGNLAAQRLARSLGFRQQAESVEFQLALDGPRD